MPPTADGPRTLSCRAARAPRRGILFTVFSRQQVKPGALAESLGATVELTATSCKAVYVKRTLRNVLIVWSVEYTHDTQLF